MGAGFAVLRFDFTGLGSSEGEFANTTFTSNVGDLVAAAAMLRHRYQAPALLVERPGPGVSDPVDIAPCNGDTVVIEVEDHGEPIPSAEVGQLFEPFCKRDASHPGQNERSRRVSERAPPAQRHLLRLKPASPRARS